MYTHITESPLCCTLETNTLVTSYTSIKKKKKRRVQVGGMPACFIMVTLEHVLDMRL